MSTVPASVDIQYTAGEFYSFRATVKIHLGKLSTDIRLGDVIQFDGTILKLGGVEHSYTELRGGVRVGWLVPVSDVTSTYKPVAADVKVRPAQDKDKGKSAKIVPTTVSDDETDVGPATRKGKEAAAAGNVSEALAKTTFSRTLQNQDQEERSVGPSTKRAMQVQSDETGNEDAKVIGKIGTPAKARTIISDGAQAARETARLDEGPRKKPEIQKPVIAKNSTILATETPKGSDIHAASADKVEDIIDTLNPEDRARIIKEQRRAKANASAEAVAGKKVEPEVPAPAAAVEAKPVVKAPKIPPKTPMTVEEVILAGDETDLGDGLKWDMKLHWLQRVKLACDLHEKDPEAFERVLAIETGAVQKHARINLAHRQASKKS